MSERNITAQRRSSLETFSGEFCCLLPFIQLILFYRNQEQFAPAIWKQLDGMCRNGKLGHAEMMLLFAYRDQVGDVKSGLYVLFCQSLLIPTANNPRNCSVSGHSVKNDVDMRDYMNDFNERIATPWNEYANHVLPRKALIKHNLNSDVLLQVISSKQQTRPIQSRKIYQVTHCSQ
jgi:hypothetical protein